MKLFTRRRFILSTLGILAAVPVIGVAALRLKDNLLPTVDMPELVLVDNWALDVSDGV